MLKRHFSLRFLLGLVCVAIFAFAQAADEKVVSVCNTTGIFVSDLHVTFSGSGGNVKCDPVAVIAPGCPVPTIASNSQVTNTVSIDWGMACIAPNQVVTFTVKTANGPLVAVSGNWTLNGVNVQPIRMNKVVVGPVPVPDPAKKFWANKIQTRCNGRTIRGGWKGIPGTPCWGRWTCFLGGWREYRVVRCLFVSRAGRLREVACFPLTPWIVLRWKPAFWFFERTTIKPPDVNKPGDLPVVGPPPGAVKRGGRWVRREDIKYLNFSDNSGDTYRTAQDMVSVVNNADGAMMIEDTTFPDLSGFSNLLTRLGPGYASAGNNLLQLLPELATVATNEPSDPLGLLQSPWQSWSNQMIQLGSDLADGSVVGTSLPTFESATTSLQTAIITANPGSQRFQNASALVGQIREGLTESRKAWQAGLGVSTNQDYFLWGLMNRWKPDMACLANALSPHIAIRLNMGSAGWEPTEMDGAQVIIENAATGERLDEGLFPISDDDMLYLPTWGTEGVANLRLRIKVDTFLSVTLDVPNVDGLNATINLTNGDVNGDEAVDPQDIAIVQSQLGSGGPNASAVPPSDLNRDGIVDGQDLGIVDANQGQTGTGFYETFVFLDLQNFTPRPEELEPIQIQVRSLAGAVLESHTDNLSPSSQEVAFACTHPGPVKVWVKGRTWLAVSTPVTIGAGQVNSFSVSLINGDCDNNNVINTDDYLVLNDAFDWAPGDAKYDQRADLDGNGFINTDDYLILSSNFDQVGD